MITYERLRNTLIALLIVVALIWIGEFLWNLAGRFANLLLIFFFAWLVSFALTPLVRRLQRARVPTAPATAIVYLGIFAIAALLGVFVMPVVVRDLAGLAGNVGAYGDDIQNIANDLRGWLMDMGLPEEALDDALNDIGGSFADASGSIIGGVIGALSGLANVVLVAALTLVVSFYMVLNWDAAFRRFCGTLPGRWGTDLEHSIAVAESTFAGYLRGRLTGGVLYGVIVAVAMIATRLDFVVAIAVLAGIAMTIPFVGLVVGLVLPVAAALLQDPVMALWIAIPLVAAQQILDNVVVPKLMATAMGVHPVVVIASILIGTTAAGFWGAVFGVPFGALVYFAAVAIYRRLISTEARRELRAGPAAAGGGGGGGGD
jgi:predicted PurR-regulated permease PerM